MSEQAKSDGNGNSFLRVSEEPLAKLGLRITSDKNHLDETVIAFMPEATDGYDLEIDAIKLSGGWVNLASKLDDDKLIAINAMGAPRGVKNVHLDVMPYYYGKYTFTFPDVSNFEEMSIVRLHDKLLNKSVNVSTASKYEFSVAQNNTASFHDRFELQLISPVKLRMENAQAKAGQEFVVPIYADQLADIISAQLKLGWDITTLSFIGIEDTGTSDMSNFDLSKVENGQLSFSDASETPIDLADGTKLFSIRFRANNGQPQAILRFEKQSIHIKAIEDIDMPFSAEDLTINILQNRFISGNVLTYAGTPVDKVNVLAVGADEEIQKVTEATGDYALDTYEQSGYTLSASKTDNFPLSEVVTTLDIIKSRRHILQIEKFASPYQEIAADVNGSKNITAIDLVEMRKIVLGIEEGFQSGLNWLFIPESYDLTENAFNFMTSVEVPVEDQDMNVNFKAVKVGDVDNSWKSQAGGRTNNGQVELNFDQLSLKEELIEIPIVVKDFNEISGYQFTITWDPTQLEYFGTEQQRLEGYFNEQFVQEGVLTTMWDEFGGNSIALDNGSVLFVLKFTAKDKNAKSLVELNSKVTEAVAFDSRLNSMSIQSSAAIVDLNELRNGRLELYQNVPNPFESQTEIQFKIAKKGKAQFAIINLLGETIYQDEQYYEPGVYGLSWDRSQSSRPLSPGVYLYRLQSNGEEVVKKMLIE